MPPRRKTPPSQEIEAHIRRWSWRLRDLLHERSRTFRSVEAELGWSSGYLSQILAPGTPALKVEHVLHVLDVLGVSAPEFFADLYGLGLPVRPEGDGGRWTIDPDQIDRAVAEGAGRLEERFKAQVHQAVEEMEQRIRSAEQQLRIAPVEVERAAERAAERAIQRLAGEIEQGPEQIRAVAARVVREELMRLASMETAAKEPASPGAGSEPGGNG
jgi:transcriptional regulator with XRE-family HTH domain